MVSSRCTRRLTSSVVALLCTAAVTVSGGLSIGALLAVGLAWEVVTLFADGLPTLSDLADPVLAQPAARAAATVGWLLVGAWLLARPTPSPERP